MRAVRAPDVPEAWAVATAGRAVMAPPLAVATGAGKCPRPAERIK